MMQWRVCLLSNKFSRMSEVEYDHDTEHQHPIEAIQISFVGCERSIMSLCEIKDPSTGPHQNQGIRRHLEHAQPSTNYFAQMIA